MSSFFEKKIFGDRSAPPAPAPAPAPGYPHAQPPVYPGTAPYQPPGMPAPAQPGIGPAPAAPPPAQTYSTDEAGWRALINSLPGQVNPGIVLAENWVVGGPGAQETNALGQCPKCGSPRYSGSGDAVMVKHPDGSASRVPPVLRCNDCGYNSAGYEQNWAAPKRVG